MRRLLAGFGLLWFGGLGCAGGSDDARVGEPSGGGTEASAGASPSDAGGSGDAGGASGSSATLILDAPDNEQDLRAFLDAKQYATWAKEAEEHASAGPHGEAVRVYYGPKAAAALSAGDAVLPAGAAAIKELTSGGSVYGHSVWVKVQEAADGGNGFFWYEIIDRGGGEPSVYGNARGASGCVGCHQTGKDYNLSTLPFVPGNQ
jgi:hypothetical protein